jgi:coenzyme Q-binding protein COQ10
VRTFSEQRQLHHSADGLFEIIADVDRYAEFLPWCVASRIRERKPDGTLIADLSIGYGSLRETFTSRVAVDSENSRITTVQEAGPFRHLKSEWRLAPLSDSETLVDFEIEFEFRSFLLDKVMGTVFESAAHKMIAAFETRADSLLKR